MSLASLFVSALLRSRWHRVSSGSLVLIRYQGRRSGETYTTPTQYADHGDGIVIFVARPQDKTWWRNFRGGHELEVLRHGRWVPMIGTAITGADQPGVIAALLDAYLARFPRVASRMPKGAIHADEVVVWCRPG